MIGGEGTARPMLAIPQLMHGVDDQASGCGKIPSQPDAIGRGRFDRDSIEPKRRLLADKVAPFSLVFGGPRDPVERVGVS